MLLYLFYHIAMQGTVILMENGDDIFGFDSESILLYNSFV